MRPRANDTPQIRGRSARQWRPSGLTLRPGGRSTRRSGRAMLPTPPRNARRWPRRWRPSGMTLRPGRRSMRRNGRAMLPTPPRNARRWPRRWRPNGATPRFGRRKTKQPETVTQQTLARDKNGFCNEPRLRPPLSRSLTNGDARRQCGIGGRRLSGPTERGCHLHLLPCRTKRALHGRAKCTNFSRVVNYDRARIVLNGGITCLGVHQVSVGTLARQRCWEPPLAAPSLLASVVAPRATTMLLAPS